MKVQVRAYTREEAKQWMGEEWDADCDSNHRWFLTFTDDEGVSMPEQPTMYFENFSIDVDPTFDSRGYQYCMLLTKQPEAYRQYEKEYGRDAWVNLMLQSSTS
jgi:hypothetical protein